MKSIMEILDKVELSEDRHTHYRVHDDKGNKEWAYDTAYIIDKCSWMGSPEDIASYIEYKTEHQE
jgi:hypothetical protein